MPLVSGSILQNRYRIEALLRRGGMGAVYRAIDLTFGTPVAIKENLEVSPAAQRQFSREAAILHQLHHTNLPRVTDYFAVSNQGQYLVMDYIEGQDLEDVLANGPVPEAKALSWIVQVLEALEYLHGQVPPVIHRDVKPANIKITSQGRVVLVDFGLAKAYRPRAPTTSGARAVTPGFAPPEQYGQGNTDARSDLYSVGATLYALLTGQAPPDSVDLMMGKAALSAPRRRVPSISPGVEAAVMKAMQPDPAGRFQTAQELRIALARVSAAGRPIGPKSARARTPGQRSASKWLWPVIGLAMAVLVVVLLYQLSVQQGRRFDAAATIQAEQATLETGGAAEGTAAEATREAEASIVAGETNHRATSEAELRNAAQATAVQATQQAERAAIAQATDTEATRRAELTAIAQATSAEATRQAQAAATAAARATLNATPRTQSVTVRADRDWQDTGMQLQEGESVAVRYLSGQWLPWSGHAVDAGGNPGSTDGSNLVEGVPHASLIGRIGEARPFFIGKATTFQAAGSGMLRLRINDTRIVDNSGSIVVEVMISSAEGGARPEDYDWVKRTPFHSPGDRGNYAVAYDSRRGVIVLFGGIAGSTSSVGDTWEWDGGDWHEVQMPTAPASPWGPAMAYDSRRGVVVLFGGLNSQRRPVNDTWEYDGTSWRQVEPAASPSPRRESCAAYDAGSGELVLFGGNNGSSEIYGDTWVYDGTAWTMRASATAPSPRGVCAMAYDPGRGGIVLFGGWGKTGSLDDTWEWRGGEWIELSSATRPPARGGHALVYHDRLGVVLMFGGDRGSCSTLYEDTWAWDGNSWSALSASRPGTHSVIASAYMADRDAVLLFGGWAGGNGVCRVTSETWELVKR